jgi:O-antigen/teichoic acid export membrane protein
MFRPITNRSPSPARNRFFIFIAEMTDPRAISFRAQIIKSTAGGFIVQVGFAALSFITATVLARLLGLEGYGAYSNAIAWVNILAALGLFGFNSLLLRELAILKARNDWALIKGLLCFSDILILSISMFLGLALWVVASVLFSSPEKENLRFSLSIAAPLIPLFTLINLRQSAMRGLQQVTRAMLPDLIIRPGLTLVCICGAYLFIGKLINAQLIIGLSIVVSIIALLISMRWLRNFLPEHIGTIRPQYQIIEWIKSAPAMFVVGGMQILIAQAPIIILGMLGNAKDVGYFAVALRVATLLIFLPTAVGIVIGPRIAGLYSQGEKPHLQNIIKKTNRLTFAATLLVGLMFYVFSRNILSIFGSGFPIAQNALVLLTIGYLIDSGFGMSILTLMMTGYEHVVAIYQTVFAVLLVVLSILLIPSHGYESAALAFTVVMIISRSIFTILAKKKTGINTTIF